MNQSAWGEYCSGGPCVDGCAAAHLADPPPPTTAGVEAAERQAAPRVAHRHAPCEWGVRLGHQAKRARVENIIRGMSAFPGAHDAQRERGDGKHRLRHLRTRDLHARSPTEEEEEEEDDDDDDEDLKYQGWKKVKMLNYFHSKPENIQLLADVLKYELSRAVTRSVDSVFRSAPLQRIEGGLGADPAPSDPQLQQEEEEGGDTVGPLYCADVQTEALSLVVQKHHLDLSQVTTPQQPTTHVPRDPPAKLDASWRVRSKVNSRSPRSPHAHVAVEPLLLESLCLPRVKVEPDTLLKNNLYILNEGLTTNHLKKAKLMFFYTRYPSSLVLKMCFHDVQFTRCITSQLIKWFSNFREFYYIQMEKFARHAIVEGVADVRGLTVGRESELFRALNMHYNKANDFKVPDKFLEVAEITLREFYIAISMGKDRDPSWKKAIYKVICKLDSDVPAEFKTHG